MDSNSHIGMRNTCKILVGTFEGKETLGRPSRKGGSKSKMGEFANLVHLVQNNVK